MKKSLFALAAVTAFAGAAQAQSSVTVYGIIDAGYVGANERVTGTAAQGTIKTQNSQFGASAQSTSRIGFRGTEDLGGGKSAFFLLEAAMVPNNNFASGGTGGFIGTNRQSFVGLANKGVGQIAFGTQNSTVFNAAIRTDVGGVNNIAGNVINPASTGVGSNYNVTNSGNTNGTAPTRAGLASNVDGNNNAYTSRISNMMSLQSANIAGFTGNAFYALNNQNSTQTATATAAAAGTGGTVNSNAYGVGVDYTGVNKLLLSANFQSIKAENNTITTTVASSITIASTGGVTLNNGTDNQMYAAGVYDFGILKAYAAYINRKMTSAFNSADTLKRSAQQIGVRGNWTPTVESWASIGTGKVTAEGSVASATANFNGWQLGSNYILSKRTNLYAIYGQEQTSSTTVGSYGLSNYAVGVRHTF
jgi:predicted porin